MQLTKREQAFIKSVVTIYIKNHYYYSSNPAHMEFFFMGYYCGQDKASVSNRHIVKFEDPVSFAHECMKIYSELALEY
jgi:hypothetical protein